MEPVLSNAAMWSLIVGFVSPIAVQFITMISQDSRAQAAIAFAFELAVAVPTAYFAASLDFHDWVKSALVIVVMSIAAYKGFWKPVGVTPSTVLLHRGVNNKLDGGRRA